MVNQKRLVQNFIKLVKIDSPSGEEALIIKEVSSQLKKLGVRAKVDKTGNVIGRLKGEGKKYFMLNAHLDTVEPGRGIKPVIRGSNIFSDGETILGADDKSGVAAILETLQVLKDNNIKHRPLEIVFTVEEETGTDGARGLDFSQMKSANGLTVDASTWGQIVVGSPYIFVLDIKIKGKDAHASEPQEGIDAIKVAAEAISKIKLGRLNKKTTANIGTIKGGVVRNGVAAEVVIQGEARSHDKRQGQDKVESMIKAFEDAAEKHGAILKMKSQLACSGYTYKKTDPFIKQIAKAMKKHKVPVDLSVSGGGSDVNEFCRRGINCVDIGAGYENCHSTREKMSVKRLVKLSEVILELVSIN
ncbi:M20/M25/M40 family metallo-hydrolase [Patescibacteria group bacterium]